MASTPSSAVDVVSPKSVIVPEFLNVTVPFPILSVCISKATTNGPTRFIVPVLFSSVPVPTLSTVAILDPPTRKSCVFHVLPPSAVFCAALSGFIESIVRLSEKLDTIPPPPVKSKYARNKVELYALHEYLKDEVPSAIPDIAPPLYERAVPIAGL